MKKYWINNWMNEEMKKWTDGRLKGRLTLTDWWTGEWTDGATSKHANRGSTAGRLEDDTRWSTWSVNAWEHVRVWYNYKVACEVKWRQEKISR